jgi:hypothetical protein
MPGVTAIFDDEIGRAFAPHEVERAAKSGERAAQVLTLCRIASRNFVTDCLTKNVTRNHTCRIWSDVGR